MERTFRDILNVKHRGAEKEKHHRNSEIENDSYDITLEALRSSSISEM